MNSSFGTSVGFTIVETMIVLAVSSLMFVIAIYATSGRQQQTEFQTSIVTFRSELNQQFSGVEDGNYNNPTNINCAANTTGSAGQAPYYTTSPPDGSCNVTGLVMLFQQNSGNYYVYPMISRSYVPYTGTNQIATNLTQAMPYISDSYGQQLSMPFGLQVASTSGNIGALGLVGFTSFEDGSGSGTETVASSGSQHAEIFAIPGSTLNATTPASLAQLIDGNGDYGSSYSGLENCSNQSLVCDDGDSQTINPSGGLTVCLNSGTTSNQSALFTIGGTNSPSQSTYQIFSTTNCQS